MVRTLQVATDKYCEKLYANEGLSSEIQKNLSSEVRVVCSERFKIMPLR